MIPDVSGTVVAAMVVQHEGHLDKLVELYRELKAKDAANGSPEEAALGGLVMAAQMMPPSMLDMIAALAIRRLGEAEVVTR